MTNKTYAQKLKDPRWQKVRLEIFERDNWCCKICGNDEQTLNCHHLKYDFNVEPWDIATASLLTVCDSCHKTIHDLESFRKNIGLKTNYGIDNHKKFRHLKDEHILGGFLNAFNEIYYDFKDVKKENLLYHTDSNEYFHKFKKLLKKTSYFKIINNETELLKLLKIENSISYLPFFLRIGFIGGNINTIDKIKLIHNINGAKAVKMYSIKYNNLTLDEDDCEWNILDGPLFERIKEIEYSHVINDEFKSVIYSNIDDNIRGCHQSEFLFRVLDEDHKTFKKLFELNRIKPDTSLSVAEMRAIRTNNYSTSAGV